MHLSRPRQGRARRLERFVLLKLKKIYGKIIQWLILREYSVEIPMNDHRKRSMELKRGHSLGLEPSWWWGAGFPRGGGGVHVRPGSPQ